ncbi:hypothetical protein FIBSPDRAFT_1042363 [Athelia psychrophila]|uniref:Uncharacterized protein n=1 Tax=Athelia psychrophila TaxID=1759441 RepID=A0A166MJH4_9AGAM|nr:hypothetical protein FIBSPDRAFT_1042363 [Fibularhizoctonia sp. CBS 109695]
MLSIASTTRWKQLGPHFNQFQNKLPDLAILALLPLPGAPRHLLYNNTLVSPYHPLLLSSLSESPPTRHPTLRRAPTRTRGDQARTPARTPRRSSSSPPALAEAHAPVARPHCLARRAAQPVALFPRRVPLAPSPLPFQQQQQQQQLRLQLRIRRACPCAYARRVRLGAFQLQLQFCELHPAQERRGRESVGCDADLGAAADEQGRGMDIDGNGNGGDGDRDATDAVTVDYEHS